MSANVAFFRVGDTFSQPGSLPERALDTHASEQPADYDIDPFNVIFSEFARDFNADGVIVTYQSSRNASVTIYSAGSFVSELAANDQCMEPLSGVLGADWRPFEGGAEAAILTTRSNMPSGLITVKAIFRRINETTRARARSAALRIQPLLAPLARLWWQRQEAGSTVRSLTAAIDRSDIGVILIDANGQPTFVNVAARQILDGKDGLRIANGAIAGNALADTFRLQAALDHVLVQCDCHDSAPVIAMPRRDRRALMVAIMPVTDAAGQAAAGDRSAILFIFDPEQDLAALIEPACKVYNLSPVETRLTCLLADGVSLSEAAKRMRVREMTARSYLKQIFLKTETNRQAELVWLMLKSTVRARTGILA